MCPKDLVSLFVFSQDQTVIILFSLSYLLFIFSFCTNISKQCLFPIQEMSPSPIVKAYPKDSDLDSSIYCFSCLLPGGTLIASPT